MASLSGNCFNIGRESLINKVKGGGNVPASNKKGSAIYNGTSESLVRIRLLTIFHRNPGLAFNCMDLAEAVGRSRETVERQIKKLLHLGILVEVQGNGETCYRYLPPHITDAGEGKAMAGA